MVLYWDKKNFRKRKYSKNRDVCVNAYTLWRQRFSNEISGNDGVLIVTFSLSTQLWQQTSSALFKSCNAMCLRWFISLCLDTTRATSSFTFCSNTLKAASWVLLQGGALLALQRTDVALTWCQPQPQIITTLKKRIKPSPTNINNRSPSRDKLFPFSAS